MFQLEKCIDKQIREITGPIPTLIFPEATDPRIIGAVSGLVQHAKIVLPARREEVEHLIDSGAVRMQVSRRTFMQSVTCICIDEMPDLLEEFAVELVNKSRGRSWELDAEAAAKQVKNPVYFSILAVRLGYADAVLGGVTHSSREFFQPCLRLLERDGTVYEMGLFALPDSHAQGFFKENLVLFADVALNPEPNAERLTDIAVGACVTMRNIIPEHTLPDINGAILSYSTRGSGAGASVDRIREAEPRIAQRLTKLSKKDEAYGTINVATELQIGCAISKEAALTKIGEDANLNPAVGAANVLIAPNLDTGNLLYHIYATRYPDATSVLIIGGLRNQALDFSRGSREEDIVIGTKVLILRMYRSGRFRVTPKDRFFPRYRILTINPGWEYTEFALWRGLDLEVRERIEHDESCVNAPVADQLDVRIKVGQEFLARQDVLCGDLAAVAGRGGLVMPLESGVYRIDDRMLADLAAQKVGSHVANLGAMLARKIAGDDHENVFIIDPAVVDEIDSVSRFTGLKGVERKAVWHALTQKSVAKFYANQRGLDYEDLKLIVVYLGAGISVGAHLEGRCVKVNNSLYEGPMGPVRAGSIPASDLIEMCYSGMTKDEVKRILTERSGFYSYLGTTDFRDVEKMVVNGDETASLVLDAMVEQIAAETASLVPKFKGAVPDQILLTGAMARSNMLVGRLCDTLRALNIGITTYPGNLEVESLRDGALRALRGIEPVKKYVPIRDEF